MSVLTPNYNFILPGVNDPTDQDLWGGMLNSNFSSIDTLLKDGLTFQTEVKTTTYAVVEADANKMLLCDAAGGAFTVTLLPAATAGDGFIIIIKKTDASSLTVTIDGNASETIDGESNYPLSGEGDSVMLVCDGTNWQVAAYKINSSGIPSASTTVEGISRLATNAEAVAGVNTTAAVVPSALAAAIAAIPPPSGLPVVTNAQSGKIVFGAVTVQWGKKAASTGGSVTFPTAFGGTPYVALSECTGATYTDQYVQSLTSTTLFVNQLSSNPGFYWMVIGPT